MSNRDRYNASDEAQVNERREGEKLGQIAFEESFKKVMQTPDGRRVFRHLLGYTGIRGLSYTGSAQTYFNEGKRAVGIFLEGIMEDLTPNEFLELFREGIEEGIQAKQQEERNHG